MDLRTLIPRWEISDDKIGRIKNATQEALHNTYVKETCDYHPVIRDLTAADLNLVHWFTPLQKQGEWSTWVEMVAPGNRYIGIYKVTQISPEPKIHTIRISIAGSIRGIHDLDAMYAILPILGRLNEPVRLENLKDIRMEAYLTSPYMIPQKTHFQIETMSNLDNKGDWLILGGYVAEPERSKV